MRRALRDARAAQVGSASGVGAGLVRETRPPYPELLARVMARYGLSDADEAVRFALERAAHPPLVRADILALEGSGWEGDLDALRGSECPESVP